MLKKTGFLFILLVFISCNFHIEKRKYFKGYHIEIAKLQPSNPQESENFTPKQIVNTSSKTFTNKPYQSFSKEFSKNEILNNLPENNNPSKQKKNASSFDSHNKKQIKNSTTIVSSTIKKTQLYVKKNRRKKNWDDLNLLGLFVIMGFSIIGLAKKFQSVVLNISNWASKNKFKTKIFIGVIQTIIALLGIGIGKNFHDMGYHFSINSSYLFSGTLLLAIIALIKQKRTNKSEPLKLYFRNKIAKATIALSSLMLMTVIGNNIGNNNPTNSPIGYMIEKNHFGLIDKQNNTSSQFISSDIVEKESKIDNAALIALYAFLGVLMAVVLMALTCAVWCWAILSAEVGVVVIAVVATIFMVLLAIYVISAMRRSIDKNAASQAPG